MPYHVMAGSGKGGDDAHSNGNSGCLLLLAWRSFRGSGIEPLCAGRGFSCGEGRRPAHLAAAAGAAAARPGRGGESESGAGPDGGFRFGRNCGLPGFCGFRRGADFDPSGGWGTGKAVPEQVRVDPVELRRPDQGRGRGAVSVYRRGRREADACRRSSGVGIPGVPGRCRTGTAGEGFAARKTARRRSRTAETDRDRPGQECGRG